MMHTYIIKVMYSEQHIFGVCIPGYGKSSNQRLVYFYLWKSWVRGSFKTCLTNEMTEFMNTRKKENINCFGLYNMRYVIWSEAIVESSAGLADLNQCLWLFIIIIFLKIFIDN